jgi:hypothetical protein
MAQFTDPIDSLLKQFASSKNPDNLYLRESHWPAVLEPGKSGIGGRLYRWWYRDEYNLLPIARGVSYSIVDAVKNIFSNKIQIESVDLRTLYAFSAWLDKRIEKSKIQELVSSGAQVQQEIASQITLLGEKIEEVQANIVADTDLQETVQEQLKNMLLSCKTEVSVVASGQLSLEDRTKKIVRLAQKIENLRVQYTQESDLAFVRRGGTEDRERNLAILRTRQFWDVADKFKKASKLDSSFPYQYRLACESEFKEAIWVARDELSKFAGKIERKIAFQRKVFEKQEIYANAESLLKEFKEDLKKICSRAPQGQLSSLALSVAKMNCLKVAYQLEHKAKDFKQNCGKGIVRLKSTGAPCEVCITKQITCTNGYKFYVHLVDCGPKIRDIRRERIGEISFTIGHKKKEVSEYFPEGEQSDMTPIIYIAHIQSKTAKYKDVGKVLLQAALEEGISQKCEDAALEACSTSHGFHYLQGFRSPKAKINAQLAKIVEQNQFTGTLQDTRYLDGVLKGVFMYLAPEGKKFWKKETTEHPILEATKER